MWRILGDVAQKPLTKREAARNLARLNSYVSPGRPPAMLVNNQ
jgi:hypothetical protein